MRVGCRRGEFFRHGARLVVGAGDVLELIDVEILQRLDGHDASVGCISFLLHQCRAPPTCS